MSRFSMYATATGSLTVALLLLSACSGGSGMGSSPDSMPVTTPVQAPAAPGMMPQSGGAPAVAPDASMLQPDVESNDTTSVLKALDDERVIGSTVVANGEQNPYGLDIAKTTRGKISAGDLVVCNFNDAANVQGTGSTIIALHPKINSTPRFIAQNASLLGCNALALGETGEIWTANFSANADTLVSPFGHIDRVLHGAPFDEPFGQAFANDGDRDSDGTFYASNAGDGAIIRIKVSEHGSLSVHRIAKNFPVNGGVPGSILAPSGLQYDAKHDRLFIVDGTNNAVYVIRHVSKICDDGITVNAGGTTFSGIDHALARVVFIGAPLNGPISSALFFNGNLAIGNTLDPNGKNLMVEITPGGKLLFVRNVDTGAAGSIFGMVASGHDLDDTKLYFNDDNMNAVEVLTP